VAPVLTWTATVGLGWRPCEHPRSK
jgi:hypothetical protein